MEKLASKQIVFITGTFISNTCWDEWITYFENHGYTCIAPAWPYRLAGSEELRNRSANDVIATNTILSVTGHFETIIAGLPAKPILIGHSAGGLVVQLLLQKQLASMGVAIHSFPAQHSIRFHISMLKLFWKTLLWKQANVSTYLVPFRKWCYSIVNGLNCNLQKELYYKYAIPESRKIIRQACNCLPETDFKKINVPLLLTAGTHDKLVHPQVNYANYKKYSSASSMAEFKEFINHPHLIFGHEAGRKEAHYILHWLKRQRSF